MQWLEICADTDADKLSDLCNKLEDLGVSGLVIEDEDDFKKFLEEYKEYWDYVDDELLNSFSEKHRVKFYLEDSQHGRKELERIQEALGTDLTEKVIKDEDWSSNWKKYYRPMEIGEKLLILPQWENADEGDRIVVKLDPGLIFGTGSHPTTKIVLETIEQYVKAGSKVLDLGCGSGILGIASLLLGAKKVVGCDIDNLAPKIALENAALNGITQEDFNIYCGDVIGDKKVQEEIGRDGKYDLVLANIVADVIINLAPKSKLWLAEDGYFICSGIIEGRENEVKSALTENGFTIVGEIESKGWFGYVCKIHQQKD